MLLVANREDMESSDYRKMMRIESVCARAGRLIHKIEIFRRDQAEIDLTKLLLIYVVRCFRADPMVSDLLFDIMLKTRVCDGHAQ